MTPTSEIIKNMNRRYATKQFDPDKKLSKEQIAFLKEALRLSPSSFGLQPWKFLFIESPELRKKLRAKAWNQAQVEDASLLIVLCRKESVGQREVDKLIGATAEATGAPEDALSGYKSMLAGFIDGLSAEAAAAWMEKQVYIALGVLLNACAQAGIDACPMEGFEREGFDEILGLKDKGLRAAVLCAVGTRASGDAYAERKKVRYPLGEIVEAL